MARYNLVAVEHDDTSSTVTYELHRWCRRIARRRAVGWGMRWFHLHNGRECGRKLSAWLSSFRREP